MDATTVIVLLVMACAPPPQPIAAQPGAAIAPEQRVAVWQSGRVDTLRAVQMGDSTVSGIPAAQPAACDSCRTVLRLASIDSVLELPPARGRFAPAAIAAAAVAGFAGIWMWSD